MRQILFVGKEKAVEKAREVLSSDFEVDTATRLLQAIQMDSTIKYHTVICDQGVIDSPDARSWTDHLHSEGRKAVLLSSGAQGLAPTLHKANYSNTEELFSSLRSLLIQK